MLGMINSMSRNIRREVITRHEEVRDMSIRNRNGNCNENEDDNNNHNHNHNHNHNDNDNDNDNDKGKGTDNGNGSGHRDGFHHGLSPSPSPGPGSLHPSPRFPDEVRATDAMMHSGISSEQTGVSVRYISLLCSNQESSASTGRHSEFSTAAASRKELKSQGNNQSESRPRTRRLMFRLARQSMAPKVINIAVGYQGVMVYVPVCFCVQIKLCKLNNGGADSTCIL
ncbi:hypothetical protein B0T13DRAFT_178019 [Neurospora crassa]|nr:hypothetical protein B0T13DRAFT_178019 [Neurospora crassa]